MKLWQNLRWIMFGAAMLAVVGLTGMNFYSLNALHKKSVKDLEETRRAQITELADQTRSRFFDAPREIWKLDMDKQRFGIESGRFTPLFMNTIAKTARDPLFSEIYFASADASFCGENPNVLKYDLRMERFHPVLSVDDFVCDGLGMARTRMKVLVDEYKWNTKVFFDTHRSMTMALVDNRDQHVMGYLFYKINDRFLIEDFIQPMLSDYSSRSTQRAGGINLWLHDWTNNEVLASSDASTPFDPQDIQINQRFPNLLENWSIKATYDETPALRASQKSLFRNYGVLSGAVLLLVGSVVVIFIIAHRERELALRQAGFLANVTHELKTPLAVMQAAGENLADGRVSDPNRLKSYGKHIYDETLRLRSMIEKLLDVAKADAGQLVARKAPYKLTELAKSYVDQKRDYITQQGFELHTHLEHDVPLVMVDKDHFEAILSNLVENAIKYSPSTKYIGLAVRSSGRNVVLSITDKGVGVQKAAQKKIFEKFYRVEDSLTAQTKGHGLGLSIVKNFVQQNGGTITLDSHLGKGSIFRVEFPVFFDEKSVSPSSQTVRSTEEYVDKG